MTTLPEELKRRDAERLKNYNTFLTFYEGEQWPERADRQARLRRLTYNYVRTVITKITSHVTDHRIEIVPDENNEQSQARAEAAEDVLRDIRQANALDILDTNAEVDAAVLGDGAYKVTWSDEDERVVITNPDVQGIFAWPHPSRPNTFRRIAQRYRLTVDDLALTWPNVPLPARSDQLIEIIEDWTDDSLDVWIDGQLRISEPNTYPFGIPILLWPNRPQPKKWNGLSDLHDLIDVAKELNSELSRLANIMELSGNPIAVLENVDETTDIRTQPGAVWELPEKAKAYLLDLLQGSSVQLHVQYVDIIYRALHDLSHVPRAAFAGVDRDLSGRALQIELRPLSQLVSLKRRVRDRIYTTRAQMALQLFDQQTGSDHATAGTPTPVTTEPIVPPDANEDGGREVALVGAGIHSRKTAMRNMGDDDPEEEWRQIKAEAAQLAALGAALSGLDPSAANIEPQDTRTNDASGNPRRTRRRFPNPFSS